MTKKFQLFDAARLELKKGTNLVEASAGTGKTYAIAMLVLRAVVELEVPIEKILVVTFTKAATEELRARIRSRLVEALEVLGTEEGERNYKPDATLLCWAETIKNRQRAAILIKAALFEIDCAAIYTIHGYCQRMLLEQALESNQLFDVELVTDLDLIRNQVTEDFWRNHLYEMAPLPCAIITNVFPTPHALMASVKTVGSGNNYIVPEVGLVAEAEQELLAAMGTMQQWWKVHGKSLKGRFGEAIEAKHFNKKVYNNFAVWFAEIDDFFSGDSDVLPADLTILSTETLLGELSKTKFKSLEKRENYLQEWPLPGSVLDNLLTCYEALLLTLRVNLAKELSFEVSKRLFKQGKMGFEDLISNLSEGLKGEHGLSLQRVLASRFKVALIDEFQDTDSKQYHIFSTLFGAANHYLYLIGDPKQAIYRFRGADIHSYFEAKKAATSLLTLEKNYRSHPFLLNEINRLFSSKDSSFCYAEDVLGYHPVSAAKSEEDLQLLQDDKNIAGMVYCSLEEHPENKGGRWNGGQAKEKIRDYVVFEVADLLDSGRTVTVVEGRKKQLAPQDIAILVRKNAEAEEYRHALTAAGIQAVVTSRSSVFQTRECWELLLLLGGVCSSSVTTKVKSAMTLSWFGFSGDELHRIWENDSQLNLWQCKMAEYFDIWQEQNFLTMMSKLLAQERVLINLAGQAQAERKIANIHQLLELVQEEEADENLGASEVIQWLCSMNVEEKSQDSGELLLESDEEAVQIVTMHSAKGLEYPVVFCPVLWSTTDFLASEKFQLKSHDTDNRIVVDLGSKQFAQRKEMARMEQAAEEVRLLYVALTRAKLRCYTIWADVKKHGVSVDSFDSPLGSLVFPDGYCNNSQQEETLRLLSAGLPLEYQKITFNNKEVAFFHEKPEQFLNAKEPSGRTLHTDWQVSSFSAMAGQTEYQPTLETAPGKRDSGLVAEAETESEDIVAVVGLPAGPNFGNVIHDLLEDFSFSTMAGGDGLELACELKCNRYGVEAEPGKVAELLCKTINSELPAGFSLARLQDQSCLKEMEFYFHLDPIVTGEINEILKGEPAVQPLSSRRMRGYLTGFVDLICEFGGRYFILDYKTNFLGEKFANYHPSKLAIAMRDHNYGLQYWIYTLVLHRHLKNILPSYSYSKHFGGVMYLFVRGMSPDRPGVGVYESLPDEMKLAELERLVGGEING